MEESLWEIVFFLGLDNGNAYTKSSEGFSCQSGFTKSDVEQLQNKIFLFIKVFITA